ncbi:MAG: RnfABCDGE type electron transport complex subunit D [Planctomycetota bacterium]|jgi:electron transport complex protein RnfD|nr:RnfABCDGE type electron transport complex subunit D [Planctomycetota bacterium]
MTTTAGPFIHSGQTNRKIMVMVLVSLSPSLLGAVVRHGMGAGVVIVSAIVGAWVAEWVFDRGQAFDGSALVTGGIFALVLPPTAPWWLAMLGGALAIGLGKHAFGGLGRNLFNPAALARVVLMGILPAYFFSPAWTIDGLTAASPLAKESGALGPTFTELLSGNTLGSLGQAAPHAVLVGGLLLVALRAVDWRIPLTYLATVAFLALVLPGSARIEGHAPWLLGNPLLHLVGGGSLLAAFFLLADPVTAPFSPNGRIAFAIIAALYTMLVRFYTPYPDGAALAVLFANATVPLIDRTVLGIGRTSEAGLVEPWTR